MNANFTKSMAAIAVGGALALPMSAQAQDNSQSPPKDGLQSISRDMVRAELPNTIALLEAGNNVVVHVSQNVQVGQSIVAAWNDKSVGMIMFQPKSSTDVAAFNGARLYPEKLFVQSAALIITADPNASQDINPLSCLPLTGNPKAELRVGVTQGEPPEGAADGYKTGDRQLFIFGFKAAAKSALEIEKARCWTIPLRLVQSVLAPQ